MKKRVSALIIAVGMAAAPLSAKPAKVKASSGELGSKLQNRMANTSKRIFRKKAEDEYIREMDEEIENALYSEQVEEVTEVIKEKEKAASKTILRDTMPNIGIDISEEFRALQGKSKSS